jgi:hypothetical protein
VELVNKNGEIVPLLLIDGSAPSSANDENIIDKKKIKEKENENIKSFAIEENEECVENEIVRTESKEIETNREESREPDVAVVVGFGAVCKIGAGAGAEHEDESDSETELFEDANYYTLTTKLTTWLKI